MSDLRALAQRGVDQSFVDLVQSAFNTHYVNLNSGVSLDVAETRLATALDHAAASHAVACRALASKFGDA